MALAVAAVGYTVEMRVTRTVDGVRLRLVITDPMTHAPASRVVTHDTPMHLFVVGGSGLRVFRHEQPHEQRDGSFVADVALPESGLYMVFAEFTPNGGAPQMAQQAFTTGSPLAGRPGEPADESHLSNGIRATVTPSEIKSGSLTTLAFDLADDESGAPVGDLELNSGALAHLFVVSADLTEGQHLRPVDDRRGPRVSFAPIFPRPGHYKLWLQVQRAGRVVTLPFVVDVRE